MKNMTQEEVMAKLKKMMTKKDCIMRWKMSKDAFKSFSSGVSGFWCKMALKHCPTAEQAKEEILQYCKDTEPVYLNDKNYLKGLDFAVTEFNQ
jgi:hypothetical protein